MVGHVSGVATMIARNAHVYAARSAQKAHRVAGTRFVYTRVYLSYKRFPGEVSCPVRTAGREFLRYLEVVSR